MNEIQKKGVEKIIELERESNARFSKGDIQWIANILSEDTLQFPTESELLDKKGYLKWLEEFLEMDGVEFSYAPVKAEVSESGDLGYCYGTTLLKVSGNADRVGKYVSVWKMIDNRWQCIIETNNFNS